MKTTISLIDYKNNPRWNIAREQIPSRVGAPLNGYTSLSKFVACRKDFYRKLKSLIKCNKPR